MEIAVMPWAQLKQPITLGPVTFLPAETFLDTAALSDNEKTMLTQYLESFQGRGQTKLPTVCLVNKKSGEFSEAEWDAIVSAAAALVFATVCPVTVAAIKQNQTRHVASSDRFLIHREYLGGEGVVQPKGAVVNFESFSSLVEHKPRYVIDGLSAPLESCIEDLGYLFDQQNDPAANRILRSLYFFARAQTNNPETTEFAKLVYLGTAFEILFDCPKGEKRIHVMKEMEGLWSLNLTTVGVLYNGKTEQRVSPAAWYQEFYKVRNAFVHGETVSTKQLSYPLNGRDWLTHRIIATAVFWAAVSEKTLQLKLASGAIQVSEEEKPFLLGAHNWALKDALAGLGWIQAAAVSATP